MRWTSVLFVCLASIFSSRGDRILIPCPLSSSLSLYDVDRDNSTPILKAECGIQAWPIRPLHFSGQRDLFRDGYMTQEHVGTPIFKIFMELPWREKSLFFLVVVSRMGINLGLLEAITNNPRIKPFLKKRDETWREEDWWHLNLWIHPC